MRILFLSTFRELFLINILLLLPLILFGLIFFSMKKGCNLYLRKSVGYSGTLIFGVIGVPIHELSHLIMCLVFRHEVTDVNLFRPKKGRYDNVLGFVKHKYNANNLYQSAGCFFIGIAPMLFGSFLIVLILRILFPSMLQELVTFSSIDTLQIDNLSSTLLQNATLILGTVFAFSNFSKPYYWLCIYLIASIALHMTISRADFHNALSGFIFLELLLFLIVTAGNLLKLDTNHILNYAERASSVLLSVLFISFLIFAVFYFISYLLYHLFH